MILKFDLNENISAILEKLEKFLTSKTVVGEPIEIGDTKLIPFISTSFGLGTGGGGGKDEKGNDGTGSGVGLGAKITPAAVLVIRKEDVQLIPIKKNSGIEKLVEMVPDILVKLDKGKKEKEEKF